MSRFLGQPGRLATRHRRTTPTRSSGRGNGWGGEGQAASRQRQADRPGTNRGSARSRQLSRDRQDLRRRHLRRRNRRIDRVPADQFRDGPGAHRQSVRSSSVATTSPCGVAPSTTRWTPRKRHSYVRVCFCRTSDRRGIIDPRTTRRHLVEFANLAAPLRQPGGRQTGLRP